MFSKLFKKTPPIAKSAPVAVSPPLVSQSDAPIAAKESWEARLQASRDDDVALLALAREAPLVEIKLSAVAALGTEEALRLAEREFRTGNHGVYRLAKQRRLTLMAQRENRAQAAKLIDEATDLATQPMVPANRLVELDKAWQLLDANALTEELQAEYARLSAQLSAQLRERGEQQLVFTRWCIRAKEALHHLTATCAAVDSGIAPESDLAESVDEVQVALASKPTEVAFGAGKGEMGLEDACRAAVQKAAEVTAQLEARNTARETREEEARQQAAAAPASKPSANLAAQHELPNRVKAAEEALVKGQLAEAGKLLLAIDRLLEAGKGTIAANRPLHTRIEAIRNECARLKGWQRWGGGRVREDLLEAAEAMALVAGQLDETTSGKLDIKQTALAIERLRLRWKDLDRLGGAGGKALWPRFDAALKAAYVPIAALQEKHRAAREKNLEARQHLIEVLDAVRLEPGTDQGSTVWREIAHALEHFQNEWRKLGPIEHTVPHKARENLLKRKAASISRIDSPLREARRVAQAAREEYIAQAKALGVGERTRNAIAKVRELQGEWQQHAKSLPLSRSLEAALWSEFKAATDAVFKRRDAEVTARDSEFNEHKAVREALIARLGALNFSTQPAEIERSVASIDREWRSAGEAASSDAKRIDERFRAARAAALLRVEEAGQRAWHQTYDTLLDKLALCEKVEAADDAAGAKRDEPWPVRDALPQAWENALAARFKAALARLDNPNTAEEDPSAVAGATDAVYLRLEMALGIPSPPEFEAARRELKLLALKTAMEGRQAGGAATDDIELLLVSALGRRATASQRDRLRTIIATLRERPANRISGSR